MQTRFLVLTLIFATASTSFAQRSRIKDETILYVWASDQAHVAPGLPGRHRLRRGFLDLRKRHHHRAASAAWKYRQ